MKASLFLTHIALTLSCATLLSLPFASPLLAQEASEAGISFEIDGITYHLGYRKLDRDDYKLANKMHIIRHIIELSGQNNIAESYEYARTADQKGDPVGSYILALQSRYGIGMEASLDRYIFRLNLAAKKDYAPALYDLSLAYERGLGVQRDLGSSRSYLQKAAQLGHPAAMEKRALILIQADAYEDAFPFLEKAAKAGLGEANFQLGICYAHGLGCEADMKRSVQHLTHAAENRHIRAMGALATIYKLGLGIPSSPEKTQHWDEQLALTLNRDDQLLTANQAYCTATQLARHVIKNDKEALGILRSEAKKGGIVTIYSLALAHYAGLGQTEPKLTTAFTLMEKAARAGLPEAAYGLGLFYLNGTGCELDHDKGVSWLERAAEKDHAAALAMLAIGYWGEDGYNIKLPRDYKKSLELNLRAAALGNSVAQNHAGYMLYRHMGRKGTEEEIQRLFEQAGENNYPSALFTLGERSTIAAHDIKKAEGKFSPESLETMCHYYRRAAELGFDKAMERLADYHKGGFGNEPDIAQRIYWLELASEFGNSSCSNALALHYIKGDGVKKNIERGLAIYERNAQTINGHSAASALANLYFNGYFGVTKDYEKAAAYYEQSWLPHTSRLVRENHIKLLLQNAAGKNQNPMKAYELMSHEFDNMRGTDYYLYWIALTQLLKPHDANYPRLTAEQFMTLEAKEKLSAPDSQYRLAVSYLRGDGGRKVNAKKARTILEKLANSGHIDALIDLSLYAQYGLAEPPDTEKALEYIAKLAKNNGEKAQLFAGLIAYASPSTPDMRAYAPSLAKAAELGNLDAQYIQHKKCNIIQPELMGKAKDKYLELAEKTHLGALIEVSVYQAVKAEGIAQLEKLANMGNGAAQYKLNNYYRLGRFGVKIDKEKAEKLLKQSVENRYYEAVRDMDRRKR